MYEKKVTHYALYTKHQNKQQAAGSELKRKKLFDAQNSLQNLSIPSNFPVGLSVMFSKITKTQQCKTGSELKWKSSFILQLPLRSKKHFFSFLCKSFY